MGETADVVLDAGHFSGIVEIIKEGRLVFANLKKTTAFLTVSNVPQMFAFFAYVFFDMPLPITATVSLLVDLVTNMVPAVSMAGEQAEANLMTLQPRNIKTDKIITAKMVFFTYLQLGVIETFAGLYAYFTVMADYGFTP